METFGPFAAGFMPDGNGNCLMRTGGVSVWVGLAHEGEGGQWGVGWGAYVEPAHWGSLYGFRLQGGNYTALGQRHELKACEWRSMTTAGDGRGDLYGVCLLLAANECKDLPL